MWKTNLRRVVAATAVVFVAMLVAAPSSSQAFKWGKNGDRARVERPNSAKDDVPIAEPQKRPAASAPKSAVPPVPVPVPVSPPSATPPPPPPPPKPPVPKKTELEKRQEELQSARKDYDRKKYKKALEKSSQLISEIRERDYLKGPDADQFRALMNEAIDLAQKSGERFDEPTVPSGISGKTLYFVF